MDHIVGVFNDPAAATRAVDQLVEAHFAPRRGISVVAVDGTHPYEDVPIVHGTRVPYGLPIGLGVGLLLGAIVGIKLLGTEVLAFSGGIVQVALFAAGLGGLIGVLWGLTWWRDRPDFKKASDGGATAYQVTVDATNLRGRSDEARMIFQRAGAVEVQ